MANIAYLMMSGQVRMRIAEELIAEYASAKNVRVDNHITVTFPSERGSESGPAVCERALRRRPDRWGR